MGREKADYDAIAPVYDRARLAAAPHLEWWYTRLAEAGELGPEKRLLDLGCGTGRFTIPLAARTGCEAVGLDNSVEMLARAQAKDESGCVAWVKGDLTQLTFPPESFDCALMSLLVHHLSDCPSVFRGVHRLLRRGGVLLLRQGTLEEIVDDVVHRFCPEAVTVDRVRTPFRAEITRWLEGAGFAEVVAEGVSHTVYETHAPVLEEFRLRVPSVLHRVSDEAWQQALGRAEAYVAQHPEDPWLRHGRMTLFVARKRLA